MKRTFIYTDDKSNKFWAIELSADGKSYTVTYGKVGSTGQTTTKNFADAAGCTKAADKLIAEKTAKGYVEQGSGQSAPNTTSTKTASVASGYLAEWQKIVDSKDKAKSLVEHFSYLIDTPTKEQELRGILKALMGRINDVTIEDDQLVLSFDDGEHSITASAPAKKIKDSYPDDFKRCLAVHGHIQHEEYMFDLAQCDVGDIGEIDEETWEKFDIEDSGDLVCPIWDYSDCWFYHPTKTNPHGMPLLCFLSHESCEPAANSHNVGSVFLYRWAENLDVDNVDFEKEDLEWDAITQSPDEEILEKWKEQWDNASFADTPALLASLEADNSIANVEKKNAFLAECYAKHAFRAYYHKKQNEDALGFYEKSLSLHPTEEAFRNRGNVHGRLSDSIKAIADYSAAIQQGVDPKSPSAYWLRMKEYWKLEKYPEAIADCSEYIRLKREDTHDAYRNRAEIYRNWGKIDEAIADYATAINAKPNAHESYLGRAQIYEQRGELDKALADLSSVISVYAYCSDGYKARAKLHLKLQQTDKAIADMDELIKRFPDRADYRFERARFYEDLAKQS